MAASRTTLLLLGLVVLATLSAAAEAHGSCNGCGGGGLLADVVDLRLTMDTKSCKSPLQVLVDGVEKADLSKALKLCPGGELTVLDLLKVHPKHEGVIVLYLEILGKNGKVVAKVVLDLNLADLVLELLDGVLYLVLSVVEDLEKHQLLFHCGGKQVKIVDIEAYIHLLGLGVGVGVKIP